MAYVNFGGGTTVLRETIERIVAPPLARDAAGNPLVATAPLHAVGMGITAMTAVPPAAAVASQVAVASQAGSPAPIYSSSDQACPPGYHKINVGTRSEACAPDAVAAAPGAAQPPATPIPAAPSSLLNLLSPAPASPMPIDLTPQAVVPTATAQPPAVTVSVSGGGGGAPPALTAAPPAPAGGTGTLLAAAGAGFLVGGPVGAAVGAGIGWFLSKPKAS